MLFEFIWPFLVYGVCAMIFALCLLAIYESKRPDQGELSESEKKKLNALLTAMSIIAGLIVGAFFAACKIWSHSN